MTAKTRIGFETLFSFPPKHPRRTIVHPRYREILILLSLSMICLPQLGITQPPGSATPTFTLPPLVVEGDWEYAPLADPIVTPANNRSFTERMTREEIDRRQPSNVSEAIRMLSPNLLRSTQNRKYRNFFDSRGEKLSVLVDGFVAQDGSSNGGMRGDDRLLDSMNPNIVESVELIKDSSALIYGTTKGGVLQIRTRKPEARRRTVSIEGGQWQRARLKLDFGERHDSRNAFQLSLSTFNSEGPDGKNAFDKRSSAFFKYFFDPNDRDSLVLTFNRDISWFGIPIDEADMDMFGIVKRAFWDNTTSTVKTEDQGWSYGPWGNTFWGFDWLHRWNARQTTSFEFGSLKVTNDFHNPRGIGANPVGHIDGHHVEEKTTSFALRHTARWAHGIISRLGYTFDHWNNPTGKLYWENRANEDRKHSYYFQNEVPLAGEKLTWDIGVRRDRRYIVREEKARLPKGATALKIILNSWEDPRTSWGTGLTWKPSDRDTLALRYAGLTITPVDRGASFDGSSLRDEKDSLVNFGIEHRFRGKYIPVLNVNFFQNDMDDAVVDDSVHTRYADPPTNSVGIRIFQNQDTVAKGFEATIGGTIRRVTGKLGVGQVHFEPDVAIQPNINYLFSLRYDAPAQVQAELFGSWVGKSESSVSLVTGKTLTGGNVSTTFPYYINDYLDLNLVLSKTWGPKGKSTRVSLILKNLLDRGYETRPFTPNYGRMASVSCESEF